MASSEHGEIRNVLHGAAFGPTVQAGAVHGGVHFHPATPPAQVVVPRQLPAPPVHFVGRAAELRELDRTRAMDTGRCRLVTITGPAGIGKSALALRWSAGVAAEFPDGQLYAELGAFDAAGPVAPGTVLGRFLRALGVALERVPVDVAEQAALFRSITADKRVLVVLDNAVSAAQARQLLPGGPGCMVLVTARWRLGTLLGDGATFVAVEPFGEPESLDLLSRTVGAERVAGEAASASALVRLCAGLPLALAVTAGRLAVHPRWSIGRVLSELDDERRLLAGLADRDDVSVRAIFDLSYQSLTERAARCYRALGQHPGAEVGVAVVAAAMELTWEQARSVLDTLVECSLVGDVSDDRYQMHDLIRLHARGLARDDPERDLVARRIAEWYLVGARAADLLLTPYRRRSPVTLAHLGPAAVVLTDRDAALEWLERERANLVAVVVGAADTMPELAWLIADSMWPLFHYRRHHEDRMVVDEVAVRCARHLANPEYEARMVKRWALAHFDLGRLDQAAGLLAASRELFGRIGDRYGVAAAIEGLGLVALAQRRFAIAAGHFTEELAICRELGERRRMGLALLNLGVVANATGDPARAVGHLDDAIGFFDELGEVDSYNAARCRIERGRARARLGDGAAGADEVTGALQLMRRLGSPRGQAQARHALGELALATGSTADAFVQLSEALEIYDRLGDGEAAELRRLLGRTPSPDGDAYRVPQP